MRLGQRASVSPRADGAYKTRIDSCLEHTSTEALRAAKNSAHIVCQPLATHLQQTLLHGPQAGEGNTRIGRAPYLSLLIVIHHRRHELFVESIKTLHIHSHWNTVNNTCHSIATKKTFSRYKLSHPFTNKRPYFTKTSYRESDTCYLLQIEKHKWNNKTK